MTTRRFWFDDTGIRLRFAAVFQGGGIRALFFPGHVFGLSELGVEKINAFAGASGDALIAVGLWSGLSPQTMIEELKARSSAYFGLAFEIISLHDILEFLFSPLLFILFEFFNLVLLLAWRFSFLRRLLRKPAPFLNVNYGCRGRKFERFIGELIMAGLCQRGLTSKLIGDVLDKDLKNRPITFRDIFELAEWCKTVGAIDSTSHQDFALVQLVHPAIKGREDEIIFSIDSTDDYKRNNIFEIIYGKETASNIYFPPLFMSTCCIDTPSPLIISSIDARFLDLPIAAAVRASAGHPFVFYPRALKVEGKTRPCTDGGLILNLPTTSLYGELPRLLGEIEDGGHPYLNPREHIHLSRSPLVIISFSTSEQDAKASYLRILYDTLGGGARSFLELQLASFAPYLTHIRHQVAIIEPHYLNFLATSGKYIDRCFAAGAQHIRNESNLVTTISLNERRSEIEKTIGRMCEVFVSGFNLHSKFEYLRAHLFLEADSARGKLIKKAFCYMSDQKIDFTDEFDSIREPYAGLTGQSILSQRAVICRVDLLQARRREASVLGLTSQQTAHVPHDLNLCLIIPIFDFRQIRYETGTNKVEPVESFEDCLATIDFGVSGPIVGVVSLDAKSLHGIDMVEIVSTIQSTYTVQTLERLALDMGATISKEIIGKIARP